MRLFNIKFSKYEKAKINRIEPEDYKQIKMSNQFVFDWSLEKKQRYDVYKIYLIDEEKKTLGLLSLKDIKEEFRIHINLIEVSVSNVGREKEYDHIAGCLIAFAAQLAFEKSYDGFVSLIPKTRLIDHYCEKYGFEQYGRQLGLGHEASTNLIKEYLQHV